MNVSEAIRQRKSVRQFLEKPVDKEIITEILETAKYAPSGTNTQPWKVYVVSGDKKQQLVDKMVAAFESGEKGQMEYNYYPIEWKAPYQRRRTECGKAMYKALNIERHDRERRQYQWALNYRAFDAPTALFFSIDSSLQPGSFFDYGMFYQSIMLAAMDHGLTTCPQAALAEYPELVKAFFNMSSDEVLLCGMAIGFEDVDAPVNQYRTERADLEEFVTFVE